MPIDFRQRIGQRLTTAALAVLLISTGLIPLGTRPAEAATLDASVLTKVELTEWDSGPLIDDPCGVTGLQAGVLLVVDCNTGASSNGWEYTVDSGVEQSRPTGIGEPTGVDYHGASNTLFASDDSDYLIYIIENFDTGSEVRRTIPVDELADSEDTEDPAYDPTTGFLYFVDKDTSGGLNRIHPGSDGRLGTADDPPIVSIDIRTPLGLSGDTDLEGLAWDPDTGHLLIADTEARIIYEVIINGTNVQLVNTIRVFHPDVGLINGIAVAPSKANPSKNSIWITDRDNDRLFELATQSSGDNAPIADDLSVSVAYETSKQITLDAFDPDGDSPITYSIVTQPQHGTLTGSGATRTYTPMSGFVGTDSFTYRAAANGLMSAPATVTITVLPPTANKAPVFDQRVPASVTIEEGETYTLTVRASDPNGHSVAYALVGSVPAGASIDASTGQFRWTPTEAQGPGEYTIRVRAHDDASPSLHSEKSVRISVLEVNETPRLPDVANRVSRVGEAITLDLAATDVDVPKNDLTYTATGLPPGLTIDAQGSIVGTISGGSVGTYTPTVTVTDNGLPAMSDEVTFTWRVVATTLTGFFDTDGHVFEADIEWLASSGITRGCNPPANTRFCPDDFVTRGQMAAFLVRALGYSEAGSGSPFSDDDGHVFEADIARLAAAGVTRGCNPPANTRFCPDDFVTRGQMAAFLVRALGYSEAGSGSLFSDDDGHVFEADIARLAAAGVTRGCNPPANTRFCPDDFVTRGQMAAFLHRAIED